MNDTGADVSTTHRCASGLATPDASQRPADAATDFRGIFGARREKSPLRGAQAVRGALIEVGGPVLKAQAGKLRDHRTF